MLVALSRCRGLLKRQVAGLRFVATRKRQADEILYERKSPIEHVLLRPDSYIGGIEQVEESWWLVDESKATRAKTSPASANNEGSLLLLKECRFVPGLYKIFDEILVNASDNYQRDSSTDEIHVDVDVSTNLVSVLNTGLGIPVKKHEKEMVYIPELIMGNLLTSSNFNDKIAKVTGGRNGYGAKLTNIFSLSFTVETYDKAKDLFYKQSWKNNMMEKGEPLVISSTEAIKKNLIPFNMIDKEGGVRDFTRISFVPDLGRFHMSSLSESDILHLIRRRCYDIAACNENIRVFYNKKLLSNVLHNYAPQSSRVFSRVNDRWQIAVGISQTGQFLQLSFVNSIYTSKGGTHVNYITDQIVDHILHKFKKEHKEDRLTPAQVKNHLSVFVNCLIENPAFSSQTKETLTNEIVEKTQIMDILLNWLKAKEYAQLATKSSQSGRTLHIPKLYDANLAGTKHGIDCTLILTEGDSAKALAINGLSVLGRDKYGVFPLRGKLLNVSECSLKQLSENEEIQNLILILGLQFNKIYTWGDDKTIDLAHRKVDGDSTPEVLPATSLRYGKVMIMADQDHDGSHIKGLLIHFFHHFWPELLHSNMFLYQFITPIVKVNKIKNNKAGEGVMEFFSLNDYERWRQSLTSANADNYRVKYYKGLGTSTNAEGKEYFSNIAKHKVQFLWSSESASKLNLAFHRDRAEDRKDWLTRLRQEHVDYNEKQLKYHDFIDKELSLFAKFDNQRSIAHVLDGLKPGQRKILYACFKRNLVEDVKVSQLSGYVSEHTNYHHGEQSLHQTMINMAQSFVGANNLPLLIPSGQFGTRFQGGKDAASARYLFTRLQPYTRLLFPANDDALLTYEEEDGQLVQPTCYIPIIPMILINGCDGVGTGWSTSIPCYNPLQIIYNLYRKLNNLSVLPLTPWYHGFHGRVISKSSTSDQFITEGIIEKVDDTTLRVSELPISTWYDNYKDFLDGLVKPKYGGKSMVKSYSMTHEHDRVNFIITLRKGMMQAAERLQLNDKFKLTSSIRTSNMHLWNTQGKLSKYQSPEGIMDEHFTHRLELYKKRKMYETEVLGKELQMLEERLRFTNLVITGELKIGNRQKADVIKELTKRGFKGGRETEEYDYLLNTPLMSLTNERMNRLAAEKEKKKQSYDWLKGTSIEELWMKELRDLRDFLIKQYPSSLQQNVDAESVRW